eukprot:730654_1
MISVIILATIILAVKSSGHGDPRYQWQVDAVIACPCGYISMWYGPLDLLPHYYQLCDGTNGTPDMRNRFPIGAGIDYQLGDTGGSHTFQITVDNLPSHKHDFASVHTDANGAHTHSHELSTTQAPAHTHGVSFTTSENGAHGHDWTGSMYPESQHTHSIAQRYTDAQGNHDHEMTAFIDDDYSMNKVTGIKAEFILDGDQPLSAAKQKYPDKTIYDRTGDGGQHSHIIPPVNTGAGSAHTHGMMGTVSPVPDHSHTGYTMSAEGGDHNHGVGGTISGGGHDHTISGMTEPIGHNRPIYFMPPYIAVYFICCVRDAPPPTYPAPVPSYPAPVPSYPAPVPSYHAPVPSYHAPVPSYHAPVPSYPAPVPSYPSGGGGYGPGHNNYGNRNYGNSYRHGKRGYGGRGYGYGKAGGYRYGASSTKE